MKSKLLTICELFIFTFIFVINTYATIINVPSDQPTIQAGINVAGNSDTVLVEPGIYFENINFNGKNVILGSYFIIADDTSYISRTIIDGNKNGSVVIIANEEDSTAVLCGFTIRQGSGIEKKPGKITGGGIYVNYADPTIKNLIISGNSALAGAGIYLANSKSFLSNIIIKNNNGDGIFSEDSDLSIYNLIIKNNKGSGFKCYRTNALLKKGIISKNGYKNLGEGGIWCSHSSNVKISQLTIRENYSSSSGGGLWSYESKIEFDNENHCNVYLNHAPEGRDISSYNSPTIHVIVDTFTVLNPTEYYATPINKFTFDIKFAKIIPIEADLFVSPDGDDANSGLSPDQPLKTIGFALQMIQADEFHPHTIYLDEGVYSPITNGEIFPIAMKSYVSLIGTDETTTILDANDRNTVVYCYDITGIEIKNLTVCNGNRNYGAGGGIAIIQSNPHLENITIVNNSAGDGGGVLIHYYSNPTLTNVTIRNNISLLEGQSGHSVGGGGILIRAYSDPILTNVLIEGNIAQRGAGIRCDETSSPQIINSIIQKNKAKYSGGGLYVHRGQPVLQNVIIEENKSDSHAAGIYCHESNLSLNDVVIKKNTTNRYGGGLYTIDSDIDLLKVTIGENIAGRSQYDYGGGIYCENSTLTFNEDSLCNIYLNKAAFGNDIYSSTQISLPIDTFTVVRPTQYHLFPFANFNFHIQTGKLKQLEGEVFVCPIGDNTNSGLSPETPIKTIDHALSILYADSLSSGTIHLAEGNFSKTSNQETFPIFGIDNITLAGAGKDKTIIDAEGITAVLWYESAKGCKIENVTITGAGGPYEHYAVYMKESDLLISNTNITDNHKYGIYTRNSHISLNNVHVVNNQCEGVSIYKSFGSITKSIISGNWTGITASNSDLMITQTEILDNDHHGLKCKDHSTFHLENVIIKENEGAGFLNYDSDGQLINVSIVNNMDGGIRCYSSTLNLSDVSILKNRTFTKGGGLYLADNSSVIFNQEKLCNIYLNKAGIGKDLFSEVSTITKVNLDTFTVSIVSDYFATPMQNFEFNIQHEKIKQVHNDLYVSPFGDDFNIGTSPEYPLKTIDMALTKIIADSMQPQKIYITKGIYSKTNNAEFFPISCRSDVHLIGSNLNEVILDAEESSRVINSYYSDRSSIRHMTIQNGYSSEGAGIKIDHSNPSLFNIHIKNNTGVGVFCDHANPTLNRVIIACNCAGHLGWEWDRSGGIFCFDSNPLLINVTMTKNGYSCIYYQNDYYVTSSFFANSNPIIINSILWDNSYNDLYCVSEIDTCSITVTHSNIHGGESSILEIGAINSNWLHGNINSYPSFLDPKINDFSLLDNSPCINAGTALFIWQADTLLNLPDSCYLGNAPDMGAIESLVLPVEDFIKELPRQFILYGNYPNPFNSVTIISFQIPKPASVNLCIYNTLGQKIKTLIDEKMDPGNHSITWDATK